MRRGGSAHDPSDAFSTGGPPTIVSLRGLDRLMGRRSGLNNTGAGTIDLLDP